MQEISSTGIEAAVAQERAAGLVLARDVAVTSTAPEAPMGRVAACLRVGAIAFYNCEWPPTVRRAPWRGKAGPPGRSRPNLVRIHMFGGFDAVSRASNQSCGGDGLLQTIEVLCAVIRRRGAGAALAAAHRRAMVERGGRRSALLASPVFRPAWKAGASGPAWRWCGSMPAARGVTQRAPCA